MRRYWRFALFAVVSSLLTFFIGVQIADVDLGAERYHLNATFDDATNLRVGDPVRLSGVRIGRVTKVSVVKGQAAVKFTLDDTVKVPTDSGVAVAAQNLLNIRELVITPGDSPVFLESGAKMDNVTSAVELGALINELGPLLEAVDPGQVNTLVNALNEAIVGNRENISGLTTDLVIVLENLASRSATITQLIDDYGVITGEVARRDGQIQQLIDNLVLLSETFNASEDALVQALEELPDFSTRLSALLDANASNLDSILADLSLITGTVHDSLDVVDGLLAAAPPALVEVHSISSRGAFLDLNFLCLATAPPPCPLPVPGPQAESVTGLSTSQLLTRLLAP